MQYGRHVIKGALLLVGASWLCFHSFWISLLSMAALPIYLRGIKSDENKKRQAALWNEFRQATSIMYSSTAAGGTLEKAIRDASFDMESSKERYPMLFSAFKQICDRLDRNVPMERALNDFAFRTGDEDIAYFVQIILIARKSGGSLSEVIRRTTETMNLRMEINAEIENILSGKKGEWIVMLIVPPAILLYMNIGSSEYMSVLYETIMGRMIMIGLLISYIIAVFMGRKILDIKV